MKCFKCGKKMEMQVDTFTGKKSKYKWRCEKCMPKNMYLLIACILFFVFSANALLEGQKFFPNELQSTNFFLEDLKQNNSKVEVDVSSNLISWQFEFLSLEKQEGEKPFYEVVKKYWTINYSLNILINQPVESIKRMVSKRWQNRIKRERKLLNALEKPIQIPNLGV